MAVVFKDFSKQLKATVDDVGKQWLTKWANEVASQAGDNTQLDGGAGDQLRKSYRADVRAGRGLARVGTPLEAGYWEEYGTGEHAVRSPHRNGWWVYIEGQDSGDGGKEYKTKADAEKAAAFLRKVKHLDARVTDGREPSGTLENAFKATMPKAEPDLQRMLNERLG